MGYWQRRTSGESEQLLFNEPLLLLSGGRRSESETRFRALRCTTLREHGRLIRVISAHDMHRTERTRYEQEI